MKPRSKFQREILSLSRKLSPLSEHQHKEAVRKAAPHIAKYNSKKEYVCLDCGHSWSGAEAKRVVCPHCGSKLEVDKSRKRNYCDREYFAVVTKCHGFQVVRMFFIQTNLKKGEKATYWIMEAFQRWLAPDGKDLVIGRSRHWLSRYCDLWDWGSNMEIRAEHYGHSVLPYKVVGQSSVIPEIKRNGYNGAYHKCSPFNLFRHLLTNNKIETAWKVGQYKLVGKALGYSYSFEKFWSSIKVAIRHKYKIQDPTLWYDLLEALDYLGKDIHNPKYICPSNLKKAHDEWVAKRRVKQIREEERWQRERRMTPEQRYLANCKEDEDAYQKAMSKFFDLEFVDNEIVVKPLVSVKEFLEEGTNLHHCVFTNRYYSKKGVLVLHALIDESSVATIEFSLKDFTILQCRGAYNKTPPEYDRITALIQANTSKIMSKIA